MAKHFGSYCMNEDGKMDFGFVDQPIRQDLLIKYYQITRSIVDIRPLALGYECARRNLEALVFASREIEERMKSKRAVFQNPSDVMMDNLMVMNQHVVNYIVTSRMFIDHLEGHLKRTFGETSDKFRSFKEKTSELYDNNFSYRFNVALRNYMAHRDLPVSRVHANAEFGSNSDKNPFMKIEFMIDLKDMLENSKDKMKKAMREEICRICDSMTEHGRSNYEMDLIPLLNEQTDWNRTLFLWVLEREKEKIIECCHFLNALHLMLLNKYGMSMQDVPIIISIEDIEDFKQKANSGQQLRPQTEIIPFADVRRLGNLMTL